MSSVSRREFLAAASVTAVAGCASEDPGRYGQGTAPGEEDTSSDASAAPSGHGSTVPLAEETLSLPMSPANLRSEARSGGPPKDGIPAIDDPRFLDADGGDEFLEPGDIVFGVARDGAAKAYPQKILVQHEICNDVIAGSPVSVTYCPLTGTVLGFERGETTFGVSGRLVNNNLIMYDRSAEAWWPQILATSIPGPWNEDSRTRSLREFRAVWTTWERWRAHYPDTAMLSTDTGFALNYDSDPYGTYNPQGGYYASGSTLFPALVDDDRYHPKEVVVGARTPDGAVAFPKESLREALLVDGTLAGTSVLAAYDPRFDTAYVYRNPAESSFTHEGGAVVADDGARYTPDEVPLDRVHAFDAMWFAWIGFYPGTNVHE